MSVPIDIKNCSMNYTYNHNTNTNKKVKVRHITYVDVLIHNQIYEHKLNEKNNIITKCNNIPQVIIYGFNIK
jgi:hypothetical protein